MRKRRKIKDLMTPKDNSTYFQTRADSIPYGNMLTGAGSEDKLSPPAFTVQQLEPGEAPSIHRRILRARGASYTAEQKKTESTPGHGSTDGLSFMDAPKPLTLPTPPTKCELLIVGFLFVNVHQKVLPPSWLPLGCVCLQPLGCLGFWKPLLGSNHDHCF